MQELDEAIISAKNGSGHSFDQISTWMKTWGLQDELAPPQPDISPLK
jgi:hypothetical protein